MLKQIGSKLLGRLIALGLVVVISLGISSCGLLGGGDSGSLKLAKQMKKDSTALSSFTAGKLLLNTSRDHYEENITYADDWITNKDSYGLTDDEVKAVEAWKRISQSFATAFPTDSTSDSKEMSAAYLGTENAGTVYGIFIYEFKAGIDSLGIDPADFELVNSIAESTGEYFFVKGNCVVAADYQFLSGNGLAPEVVQAAVGQ